MNYHRQSNIGKDREGIITHIHFFSKLSFCEGIAPSLTHALVLGPILKDLNKIIMLASPRELPSIASKGFLQNWIQNTSNNPCYPDFYELSQRQEKYSKTSSHETISVFYILIKIGITCLLNQVWIKFSVLEKVL